ncbi:MAG: anthranilate synthase component I family protein [Reichenbachiella sp.]
MKRIEVYSKTREVLGDMLTPVSIYMKIRDKYPNSFLLESSDYRAKENSISYIGFSPLAEFIAKKGEISIKYPNGHRTIKKLSESSLREDFTAFSEAFDHKRNSHDLVEAGLFGFSSYETVTEFQGLDFDESKKKYFDIPLMQYFFFEYVIAFDHFKNKLYISQNGNTVDFVDNISEIVQLISAVSAPSHSFETNGIVESEMEDQDFKDTVLKAIDHCQLGDTFQMVVSRAFSTSFKGDDFTLYRALRSINPSPYLFYFDYGSFKIFGSSPEAQIEVKEGKASIYPIAGTYKRTGDDEKDAESAKALFKDVKENSEHVMLVDLARNDLSISGDDVVVEKFKEIQFFSHVIHLVSKVTNKIRKGKKSIDLAADTFPAGTLSGAPKHRAMQLIDKYEKSVRGYYGGMIGLMDFHGNFNHAILIRSFLSQNNTLHFRAGAGVVAKSDPDSEVQEVYNKVGALKSAIEKADSMNKSLELLK